MTIWTITWILKAWSNPTEKKRIRLTDYEQPFQVFKLLWRAPSNRCLSMQNFQFHSWRACNKELPSKFVKKNVTQLFYGMYLYTNEWSESSFLRKHPSQLYHWIHTHTCSRGWGRFKIISRSPKVQSRFIFKVIWNCTGQIIVL